MSTNGRIHPIPGPDDIARRELPNGIVVLARENFNAQSVVLAGTIPAGAFYDTDATAGLADFTAEGLLYGTTTRSFEDIHETLEGIGADVEFNAGISTCGFGGKSLAEDLPVLLDVLQDALRYPTFPAEYVELMRGQAITGLQMRQHDTRYRAGRAFRELAYDPAHPYHRSSSGTLDTVPNLTRDMMVEFHRKYYGPQGMVVVVVGAVQAEAALNAVEAALGDWENPLQPGRPVIPAAAPLVELRQAHVLVPGKTQSDIVLGVPGPSRQDPEFHAARMANSVLGLFGMMGRLGKTVREAQGLAYYSYSLVEGESGPGPWRVLAGVNPANVQQAVDSIVAEIERLTQEPVSAEDLADNKANFTGRLPLQLEKNEGVAGSILRMERYDLGLDYLRNYANTINALTAEEVLAAAQQYFKPGVYALAVAGPNSQ
jgi:zinc protease